MKTLYLFRHAKSSWEEPLPDLERPLAPRGRRAAPAMAARMEAAGLVPERVLCSPAVRTRQTWERLSETIGSGVDVQFRDEIYEARPGGVLELVRSMDDGVSVVMVIGHNPTLQELALGLAGSGPRRALERLRRKFPTAALAVLEFDVERWSEVEEGEGRLSELIRPKDLPEAEERGL